MGNNTVALILNDFSGDIGRTGDLGQQIDLALRSGQEAELVGQGIHMLACAHADGQQVVMAGGNRITSVAWFRDCPHTVEGLLRALADGLGYDLVSRRKGA